MRHSLRFRLLGMVASIAIAAFASQGFGVSPASATSPGSNGRIAFTRLVPGTAIYSVSANGTGIKKLITKSWDPSWSPDGSRLAFASYRSADGANAIWVMNADGSGLRQLTHPVQDQYVDGQPTWSPDGSQIAFSRDNGYGKQSNIWIVNADGTGLRQLTTDNLSSDPAWAPSGIQIAFTVYSVGSSNLAVINADGTGLHIIGGPSMDYWGPWEPSWSPNGSWIAFVLTHRGEGTGDIWIMKVDGTRMHRLTHRLSADDTSPSWSPDGRLIAFSSDRSGSYKIWTIRVDGTGAYQVTWLSTVTDLAPNWRPISR